MVSPSSCSKEKNAPWQPPSCWFPPSIIDHIWRKHWGVDVEGEKGQSRVYEARCLTLCLAFRAFSNPAASFSFLKQFPCNILRYLWLQLSNMNECRCSFIKGSWKQKIRVNRGRGMMLTPKKTPKNPQCIKMWALSMCEKQQNNKASLTVHSLRKQVTAH